MIAFAVWAGTAYTLFLRLKRTQLERARSYTVPGVPDRYDGGAEDFATVLEMLEEATGGLLEAIRSTRLK